MHGYEGHNLWHTVYVFMHEYENKRVYVCERTRLLQYLTSFKVFLGLKSL